MKHVIKCTADRLPACRAGQFLAYRDATQETWADTPDNALRFDTQAQAQEAVKNPGSEAVVKG